MSGWIKHDGKSCPVDLDAEVYVKWGDGTTDEICSDGTIAGPTTAVNWGGNHPSANWFWSGDKPSSLEIAEYRVVTQ